ncbi:hypothetical protein N3K66_000923 [Trichothecium roseum]|uniref:Uncharacterized protein n=1 Tax=Trichothecium roseum TaxID=47278 RepID=A0ACC0VDW3_9HYPO|nr:hypothetical protein N3K66_000923 [Trichothecium roseum]
MRTPNFLPRETDATVGLLSVHTRRDILCKKLYEVVRASPNSSYLAFVELFKRLPMRVPSVSTPEERHPAGARMW